LGAEVVGVVSANGVIQQLLLFGLSLQFYVCLLVLECVLFNLIPRFYRLLQA